MSSRVCASGKTTLSSIGSSRRLLFLLTVVSLRMMARAFLLSNHHPCSCNVVRTVMKRKCEAVVINRAPWQASRLFAGAASDMQSPQQDTPQEPVSLYRSEGIFAVEKPLDWTSYDVVSHILCILERDARGRGAKPVHMKSRRNKSRIVRVGHGGTLDPLASGVLVIGVGKGTKELQSFLSGPKRYTAKGEFGFETTTLDMDEAGQVTKRMPYDHVTVDALQNVLPNFVGEIMQVPPIFSAIRKGGKKMYEQARKGKTAEELKLDARQVHVYSLKLIENETQLPRFALDIECGGGTYVRSLIRDIAHKLDTVATMTALERTQQGQFTMNDVLEKKDWNADSMYAAIDKVNQTRQTEADTENTT